MPLRLEGFVTPSEERISELCSLAGVEPAPTTRLDIALGTIHDAACAKEQTNAFAQTFTALEVLTEHLAPPTVLNAYINRTEDDSSTAAARKTSILAMVKQTLQGAGMSSDEADRIAAYSSMAQSISRADVFVAYFAGLGTSVSRSEVRSWQRLRGALVHAATSNASDFEEMSRFRTIVRQALLEELRRAKK